MKHCRSCGAAAPVDAEHCSNCPASFPAEVGAPPAPPVGIGFDPTVGRVVAARLAAALVCASVLAIVGMCLTRSQHPGSHPSGRFDPISDARRDLQDGIARAKVTHRRVLIEVGGNWCLWSRRLEEFFAANADLADLRDRAFVSIFISVTPEHPNTAALSDFPGVPSYPHFFVLDEDGKLLASQDARELEAGAVYDRSGLENFLRRHAPAAALARAIN